MLSIVDDNVYGKRDIMNKKKIIIVLLLVCLTLVGGGTLAYFNSRHTNVTSLSTDIYQTKVTDSFTSPDEWLPGTYIERDMKFQNTGNVKVAVRATVEEYWITANGDRISNFDPVNGCDVVLLNAQKNETFTNGIYSTLWTKSGYGVTPNYDSNLVIVSTTYYYPFFVEPGDTTDSIIKSISFNPNATNELSCTTSNGVETCTSTGDGYDGATYHLNVTFESVQSDVYLEYFTELEKKNQPVDMIEYNIDLLKQLNIIDKPFMDSVKYTFTDNNWQRGQSKNLGNINYTNDEDIPLLVFAKVKESWIDSNGHEITKDSTRSDIRFVFEYNDGGVEGSDIYYLNRQDSTIPLETNTILDLDVYEERWNEDDGEGGYIYHAATFNTYSSDGFIFFQDKILSSNSSIEKLFSTVTYKDNISSKYNNATYKLEIEYNMIDASYCDYSYLPNIYSAFCDDFFNRDSLYYDKNIINNQNEDVVVRASYSYEWKNKNTNQVVNNVANIHALLPQTSVIKENNYYYNSYAVSSNSYINLFKNGSWIINYDGLFFDNNLFESYEIEAHVDLDNQNITFEFLMNDTIPELSNYKLVVTVHYETTSYATYKEDWHTKVNIYNPNE